MAKTPGQPKRGKGGRFVADAEPAPEGQKAEDLADENDWSRGEGFGSVGPTAFGTPTQQASLGDLQARLDVVVVSQPSDGARLASPLDCGTSPAVPP